jgi:DNA-binding CsgD family transcriptional regulator
MTLTVTGTYQSAIVDSLSDVMVVDELEPAIDILRDAHQASDAAYFCFPRYACGACAQDVLKAPPNSSLREALGQARDRKATVCEIEGVHWLFVLLDDVLPGLHGCGGLALKKASPFAAREKAAVERSAAAFAAAHRRIRRFSSVTGQNVGLTSLIEHRLGACAALATPKGELLWLSESARATLGTEGTAALKERIRASMSELQAPGQNSKEFVLNIEGKNRLFGAMSFVRENAQSSIHYIAVELRGTDVDTSANEFKLTRSELEVYKLLMQGMANEAIAKTRFVSIETVRSHVKSVFRKMGVSSRVELLVQKSSDGSSGDQQA